MFIRAAEMREFTYMLSALNHMLMVLLLAAFSCAERDFNFNESQVPLLEPKEEPIHQLYHIRDAYAMEMARCQNNSSDILLTVVLKNHDWADLTEGKKAKIIEKLSSFFAIPQNFIATKSVSTEYLIEMQKTAIHKGRNKCDSGRRLGIVSFMIGCGHSYFAVGAPIAKQINAQIRDGSIDNIAEEKFGWWIIWRTPSKASRAQRARRHSEGSGIGVEDYDDDYEYGDEEDDNVEIVTDMPIATTHAHRHHHAVEEKNGFNENTEEAQDVTAEQQEKMVTANKEVLTPNSDLEEKMLLHSKTLTGIITIPPLQSIKKGNDTLNGVSTSTIAAATTASTVSATTLLQIKETTSGDVSTFSSTEISEAKLVNLVPMIKTRLKKIAVTSGKFFTMRIPEDTFYDNEDNSNLRLELTENDGRELKPTSWIQFNKDNREIYGVPIDDTVSKYSYILSATDSGNKSVTETVEIAVQQHHSVRSVNHEIHITVNINDTYMHSIDWEIKLIKAISTTLADKTTNAIVVREIRQIPQEPNAFVFVYFNETLSTSVCPKSELHNLVMRLDVNRLHNLVGLTLTIKSISGQLIGTCANLNDSKPKSTMHLNKNLPPIPRNQVDQVNATVGHLLVYKVLSDTFYDPNDNELLLTLKTKEHKDLSPSHWLQFDSKNHEFYGIPKSSDIGSEQYMLVAKDTGGLSATDALVVVVSHAPKKEFSVFFKAYLAIRHELFNADMQRKFVERIAYLFGDQSTQNVQIRSVTTHHDSDGTIVNFYNTSLFKLNNRCPEEQIEKTRSVYLLQDHVLRDRVKKILGLELNITNVQVIPFGSCYPQIDISHREFIPPKADQPSQKSTFTENYLYTFILPAVIIIAMLLIAAIIACCLHRRQRKCGKMEIGNEEERKSFRTKGIPVIFQDELDEKPEIGNKSPIILKDEKPPLLPPSYNTSNINGDNDLDEYVPPPAVVVGGRDVRGKSPATPSYRKPPPYVSP